MRPPLQRTQSKNTRRKRIWDLLRHIPTFTIRFLRLMSFVLFLLPAFVVFAWHYATCDRIAAYYGDCHGDNNHDTSGFFDVCNELVRKFTHAKNKDPYFSRHYLDIYGSKTPSPDADGNKQKQKPVVIFLTGGAWIIGYRMWGALLARALAPFGILVIIPDYRNFPRVNIDGMVHDVDMCIQWVFDHCDEYGGDKDKVVLVGQSAGAHIGGVVVAMKVRDWLRREQSAAMEELNGEEINTPILKSTYSPQQLCGYISTSSPDNLVTMRPVFHHHGLSASVQKSIFGGDGDQSNNNNTAEEDVFEKWSPYHLVKKAHTDYLNNEKKSGGPKLCDIFPQFCVVHGTADKTVPVSEAIEFIALLTKLQIPTEVKMYKGWTHTDPILEAPMRGNHLYHRDIYELVCLWTDSNDCPPDVNGQKSYGMTKAMFDDSHSMLQPICPRLLVEAARFCNPF